MLSPARSGHKPDTGAYPLINLQQENIALPTIKQPPAPLGHWKLKILGFLLLLCISVTLAVNSTIFVFGKAYHYLYPEPVPIHRILIPDEMIPAILHDVPASQMESVLLGNRRTIVWLKNHEYIETAPDTATK